MKEQTFSEKEIINLLTKINCFKRDEQVEVKEIGNGNINTVFRAIGSQKSFIIKKAYPYVRVSNGSWPLSPDRTAMEVNALKLQNQLAAGLVPNVIYADLENSIIVMEDLSHLEILRDGMNKMIKYPLLSESVSTFFANIIFFTSDFFVESETKKKQVKSFLNVELCKISEDLIFTEPYYNAERNNINPSLFPFIESVFWKNDQVKIEIAKLKYKFLTASESLLHGDLHTGSVFAGEKEIKIFDPEFAFYGPSGFDIGLLTGNLFINYFSWDFQNVSNQEKNEYQKYILNTVSDIYIKFQAKFIDNWDKNLKDLSFKNNKFLTYFLNNLFCDAIGFAAAAMIRRMHGFAHNIDIDRIENLTLRSQAQIKILETASKLILKRHLYRNIDDVAKEIDPNYTHSK